MRFPINWIRLVLFICGFSTVLRAAPANDDLANCESIAGTNIAVAGNNFGATIEPGEDEGAGWIFYPCSVWYEWTAPQNGVVYLSATAPAPEFQLHLTGYRGSTVDTLTPVAVTPDGGYAVAAGDPLKIRVSSVYSSYSSGIFGVGPFTLRLRLVTPGATSGNDNFEDRLPIATPTYHFEGSIYGATVEPGEPLAAGSSRTLWWGFVPPENGILGFSNDLAQLTLTASVFEGTELGALTPVLPLKSNLYYLQAGHNYAIQEASGNDPGGNFTLEATFFPAHADQFATADPVEGTNISYLGNCVLGTLEPGEPVPGDTNTVWMAWAAPATGYVDIIRLSPYSEPQHYAVFTGSRVDALQPVPLSYKPNNYRFLAQEGTVYHFQFSGPVDCFDFHMEFHPFTACLNDNFATAPMYSGNGVDVGAWSVLGATLELGEPEHMGTVPQKSLWWKWQAPAWGNAYVSPMGSLVPDLVLAIYTGDAVETLKLIAKSTNSNVEFPIVGGQTYCIAAAVPTNEIGDVALYLACSIDGSVHDVPGNILQEPSWENTALENAKYWKWSGTLGGWMNGPGGVDGITWPLLQNGSANAIWQDITTIPGHSYQIQFAFMTGGGISGDVGNGAVAVLWDTNQIGVATIAANEAGYWHWASLVATAGRNTAQVKFQNQAHAVEMDAFSVVDMSAAPEIVTQPASLSTIAAGTAAFIVGTTGTAPMAYQWYFQDAALDGQTAKTLFLNQVVPTNAGDYYVVITNTFGVVTSAVCKLTVNALQDATILYQPYGDTVPLGDRYNFSVVAAGTPPLQYQWLYNDDMIPNATNSSLVVTNVQATDAGTYAVVVANKKSVVRSLPAVLAVTAVASGGGVIEFRNGGFAGQADAPIYDVDGATRLNGSPYLAQLYAGPSLDRLRPAGLPAPFEEGFGAGYFMPQTVTLANVMAGSNAFFQVRAWDANYGGSYEQARATGGKFGKSDILQFAAGGGNYPAQTLDGLKSFSLQAGLPFFEVANIRFLGLQPLRTLVWELEGQPGSIYLIEKSRRTVETIWRPFTILTNETGTVTFTDTAEFGSANVWYRSRILD